MSWDKEPPKKEELEPIGDWASQPPTESEISGSPIRAAIEGIGQGASLGYADELKALTEQVTFPVASFLTGMEVEADPYIEARDKYARESKQLAEQNPASYMAGNVGGAIATGIASAPLTGVKALTGMGRLAQASGIGGAMGAIQDVDGKEGELSLNLADRAKNAGIGAVTGGLFQGASDLASKAPAAMSDAAEWLAAKSLGAERNTVKSLGAQNVKNTGRYALEEGLISPLASTDDLIARNKTVQSEAGKQMGDVYKAIDEQQLSTFNPLSVASKLDEQLAPTMRSPLNRGEVSQFENTLETILQKGDKNIPLAEAQELKELLGTAANWKNNINITPKEQMARDAYKLVRDQIDDAVNTGATKIGSDDLLGKIQDARSLYSSSKSADKLLQNKQAREQGNKIFGLTDAITGAGSLGYGGMTGDWQTAVGIMGAKKGLEKFGSNIGALSLDKVSKALMKSPQWAKLAKDNPQVFSTFVTNMAARMQEDGPQQGQAVADSRPLQNKEEILQKTGGSKYAQVMQKAAEKGGHSLAAANYVLSSRDSSYRKLMDEKNDDIQNNK